jgi:hypothetical protein
MPALRELGSTIVKTMPSISQRRAVPWRALCTRSGGGTPCHARPARARGQCPWADLARPGGIDTVLCLVGCTALCTMGRALGLGPLARLK